MDTSAKETTLVPAYLYDQYSNDKDVATFIFIYNQIAQEKISWVDNIALTAPIYTKLCGDFLTWIGTNLYGIPRPLIKSAGEYYDGMKYDVGIYDVTTSGLADDSTYKKLLTWLIYKGDERIFSIPNLKRRIARWILPDNAHIDGSEGISITMEFDAIVNIILPADNPESDTFINAFFSNILDLPIAYTFNVTTN